MTKRLLLLAMALGGCQKAEPAMDQSGWLEDRVLENRQEVTTLEARIADLEAKLAALDKREVEMSEASIQDHANQNDEIDRLTRNDQAFIEQIDYLRYFHGVGPMPQK